MSVRTIDLRLIVAECLSEEHVRELARALEGALRAAVKACGGIEHGTVLVAPATICTSEKQRPAERRMPRRRSST